MNQLTAIISPVGNRDTVADFDRQRFRWRLDWVIQIKAGNPAGFARLVKAETGVSTSEPAIRKWRNAEGDTWIGGKHLRAIGRACKDISVDWLLGLCQAESSTEVYIDSQIDQGRFALLE